MNGQFLKVKGAMTMENLMDVMIEKCSVECNDILRSLVSQHNAIAGLYLIRNRKQDAINHYTTVLKLMKKYNEQKLKIDTCQVFKNICFILLLVNYIIFNNKRKG